MTIFFFFKQFLRHSNLYYSHNIKHKWSLFFTFLFTRNLKPDKFLDIDEKSSLNKYGVVMLPSFVFCKPLLTFRNQHSVVLHRLFCKKVNLQNIDLKFSGSIFTSLLILLCIYHVFENQICQIFAMSKICSDSVFTHFALNLINFS